MKTTIGHDQDEALGNSLMEILGRLREHPSRGSGEGLGEALSREADRFVEKLAVHLRYADGILFPALRELEPGSASDLESLMREHQFLHLRARDLALQIRDMDNQEAYGLTRSVLAALLDHIQREAEDVDRFVRSLDASDARRLSRTVIDRPLPGDQAGGS